MKTEQVILCLGMIISLWIISMIAKPLDNQQETMIISTEMILPSNQMKLIIEENGKKHPRARNKYSQAKGNKKISQNYHSDRGKKEALVSGSLNCS